MTAQSYWQMFHWLMGKNNIKTVRAMSLIKAIKSNNWCDALVLLTKNKEEKSQIEKTWLYKLVTRLQ